MLKQDEPLLQQSLIFDPPKNKTLKKNHMCEIVQRAAQAQDPLFQQSLFSTLMELGAVGELLNLDCPELHKYLRTKGGLPASGPDRPDSSIGPLNPSQVKKAPRIFSFLMPFQRFVLFSIFFLCCWH